MIPDTGIYLAMFGKELSLREYFAKFGKWFLTREFILRSSGSDSRYGNYFAQFGKWFPCLTRDLKINLKINVCENYCHKILFSKKFMSLVLLKRKFCQKLRTFLTDARCTAKWNIELKMILHSYSLLLQQKIKIIIILVAPFYSLHTSGSFLVWRYSHFFIALLKCE